VDAVFSMMFDHRPDLGVPLVTWIPDFQHVHLPEMFPEAELRKRDRQYLREMQAATLVYATAEAVRQDAARFAPQLAAKVRVLPLVVPVPPSVYDANPREIMARHGLPFKYIYAPNQFWKHKNHLLVLDALRILQARRIRPVVLFTGKTDDPRNPAHFAELQAKVDAWNLSHQVIIRQALPWNDVLGIMRQAVALLNPSLFEGFGLSVAEAKTLGKRVILSDLPVHREHDTPGALYFDPRDPQALAAVLGDIWESTAGGPELEREAGARAVLPERQQDFGRGFLELLQEAADRYGSQVIR
jgi:glycosyltransferase involved in cell wall biosynthesis